MARDGVRAAPWWRRPSARGVLALAAGRIPLRGAAKRSFESSVASPPLGNRPQCSGVRAGSEENAEESCSQARLVDQNASLRQQEAVVDLAQQILPAGR